MSKTLSDNDLNATPRASHSTPPPSPDTLPIEYESDFDSEDEMIQPVLIRSTNLMGNTGKQEKEPEDILPLV